MQEKASSYVAAILDHDQTKAMEALCEMEDISNRAATFYQYFSVFQAMMDSNVPHIRICGFRMYCAIAKWDVQKRIEPGFLNALSIFLYDNEENIVEALYALKNLIPYKRQLIGYVEHMIGRICLNSEAIEAARTQLSEYIQLVKSFDYGVDRRHSHAIKWLGDENLHAMWVADMEFACAPGIRKAMQERLNHGVFGYDICDPAYFDNMVTWWKKRYDTTLKKECLAFVQGVIPALSSILRTFTKKSDVILVQEPVYHTFRKTIEKHHRTVLSSDLIYRNGHYVIDWKDLENKLALPEVKMMILCNPHNPIGKIWDKDTLIRIAQLCKQAGVLLISDEIHCDLSRMHKRYVPSASLPEALRTQIISLYSVTKTFNLAGLHAAMAYCEDETMYQKMKAGFALDDLASSNSFGSVAAAAAYETGGEWLDLLRIYLDENLRYMQKYLAEHASKTIVCECEATYLAWVDISAYVKDIDAFCTYLRQEHGLFVSNGGEFQKGACFLRINFAAPRSHVEEGMKRLCGALEAYCE